MRLFMAVFAVVCLLVSGGAAEAAENLRAGAFAIDTTPTKFPISVNGGMRDRQAKVATDRLHARCLVLDDGKTKLAIAVVDACMLPRDVIESAKQQASAATGIARDHICVSATHTHTAPTVTACFQSDPDPQYQVYLARKIAEGIAQAHEQREPAQIGWAVGHDATQVFNRRWLLKEGVVYEDPFGNKRDRVKMNPGNNNADVTTNAGPIDPQVPIVAVRAVKDGRPIALLANYSLHYVGGIEALSADYFGAFANRVAELVGAEAAADGDNNRGFVGIMSNGTSGDINNVDFSLKSRPSRKSGEQVAIVADSVAQAAYRAYRTIDWRDHVTLDAAETDLTFGVRKPTAEEIERAKGIIEAAKAAGKKEMQTLPEVYARETVLIAEYPDTVPVKLQAMRIGEVGIAAIPCEVFVEIGLEIKALSPLRPTFTIELANGYNGYLPTPTHHALGGYETWRARSSYLETNASVKITRTVLDLLNDVAKQGE